MLPEQASASSGEIGSFPVCLTGNCGLVDGGGNWIVKPDYAKLQASGPYWVAHRQSGLVGLLDAQGKTLIPPRFRSIGRFVDGLAPAQGIESENYGFIRPDGSWAIEPRFWHANPFSEGVALVSLGRPGSEDGFAEFIDREGKAVFGTRFSNENNVEEFVNGLARVSVKGKEGSSGQVLINRAGKIVVAPHPDQNIELGRDGVAVVRRDNRFRLIDGTGRTLFEVSGEESYLGLLGEGLASFERPGKGMGLVDVRSGRIVAGPIAAWSGIGKFSEGLASLQLRLPGKGGEYRAGYIDRSGKLVIPTKFGSAEEFRGGVALVDEGDGRSGLIDRSGNWLHKPREGLAAYRTFADELAGRTDLDNLVRFEWRDANGQETAVAYPPEKAEGERMADLQPILELLAGGRRPVASLRRHPCGVQVVVNARGERIWPENLIGQCAEKQLADVLERDEEKLSAPARAAYREERKRIARHEAEWSQEVRVRDRYTGSLEEMMTARLYPAKAKRDAALKRLIENAGWITGEAEVALLDSVRIKLPPGLKLLTTDRVAALREQRDALYRKSLPSPPALVELWAQREAGTITREEFDKREAQIRRLFPEVFTAEREEATPGKTPAVPVPTAFLADSEDRWQATVVFYDVGHMTLDSHSLPDAEALLDTLRTYGFWRNNGGLSSKITSYSTYSWVAEPRIDKEPGTLTWAFKHSTISTTGYGSGVQAGIARLGRTGIALVNVSWQGPFAASLAETYFDSVVAAAQQIEFAPGHRYGDFRQGDPEVADTPAKLITGNPPESLEAFGEAVRSSIARDEAKRRGAVLSGGIEILGILIAVVVPAVGGWQYRRQRRTDTGGKAIGRNRQRRG